MESQGAELLIHHNQLAIMGILGVIQNLQRLKGLFKTFGEQIETFQPDAIIFIDYGGFNLKAAKIANVNKMEAAMFQRNERSTISLIPGTTTINNSFTPMASPMKPAVLGSRKPRTTK